MIVRPQDAVRSTYDRATLQAIKRWPAGYFKMLKLDTWKNFRRSTQYGAESSTLEYKASPSVGNTTIASQEWPKTYPGWRMLQGGQFVYGMTEHDHQPAGLDAGINPHPLLNGLWFEPGDPAEC